MEINNNLEKHIYVQGFPNPIMIPENAELTEAQLVSMAKQCIDPNIDENSRIGWTEVNADGQHYMKGIIIPRAQTKG